MANITGTDDGEGLGGGDEDDLIRGLGGDDYLDGARGDDTLRGGKGDDFLIAGGGLSGPGEHDVLIGGMGADFIIADGGDVVDGGAGRDTLWLTLGGDQRLVLDLRALDAGGAVAIAGGSFRAVEKGRISLGGGDDLVRFGDSPDVRLEVDAGWGDDRMIGAAAGDFMVGGGGADTLRGGEGNDVLVSGGGGAYDQRVDVVRGGGGDDVLYTDGAYDILYGGAGVDTFVFEENPGQRLASRHGILMDLQAGETISLERIDADYASLNDNAFHFVGSLTGAAREALLTYDAEEGVTYLYLATGGGNDMMIAIMGDQREFDGWIL
ncbi:MAG TPA: M10 family metallopeptidase C-terminal domain-containing protein [Caulobacteraceae bacterium]|jgi:Ca2+-binding RTX toxin-like protein